MRFPGPELSRFSIATAVVFFMASAAGALLTNGIAGPVLLYGARPHSIIGVIGGMMTAALLAWLIPSNTTTYVRSAGWVAATLFAIAAALPSVIRERPLSVPLAVLHACVAPLLLSAIVVVSAYTWPGWEDSPEPIDLKSTPMIAMLADAAPFLTLLQISLGAAYRHKALGVMPHMAGAMLVALPLLIISVVLLQQFPKHVTIRPIAVSMMSILLLQVALGITAFVMRLLDFDTAPGFPHVAAAHVTVGALTLAVSVVGCVELRRCRVRSLD